MAILGSGAALGALLIAITIHYWQRTFGTDSPEVRAELPRWAVRGLATPFLFVVVWNVLILTGFLKRVVPLMPGVIATTRQQIPYGDLLATAVGISLLLVCSFWAATSLARLLPHLPRRELFREHRVAWAALYLALILPAAGLLLHWVGSGAAGFSATICLLPVAQVLGTPKPRPQLSYARAMGRLKRGHYTDAESAVIEELEKCDDDFEGWMLLATLYAENFRELESAEATIQELIEQPNLSPFQISQALNRLADWQLKLAEDPQSARRTLRELISRCEGTPFARTAEYRLAQMPLDREELIAQRTPRKIRLPSLSDATTGETAGPGDKDRSENARREFERISLRLGLDPDNTALLERSAILRAEALGEPGEAIRTVESLLSRADCPPESVPRLLSHLATWQLKFKQDKAAARSLLERLVRDHPGTSEAYGASSRLWDLEQEAWEHQIVAPSQPSPIRIVVKIDPADTGP